MEGTRTSIRISASEERWLAAYCRPHGVLLAAAVHRAIACLKAVEGHDAYRQLLQDTGEIWGRDDAPGYRKKIRSDWESLHAGQAVTLLSAEIFFHRNPYLLRRVR